MRDAWCRRAIAAGAALALDRPARASRPLPGPWHPVAVFGTAIAALERRFYDDRRAPGALLAAAGVGAGGRGGRCRRARPWPRLRGHRRTGLHRGPGGGRRPGRRRPAPARGPAARRWWAATRPALDEAGIARAVVESVAENTTDAIVAPALWTRGRRRRRRLRPPGG